MTAKIYQFPLTKRIPEEIFFNTEGSAEDFILKHGYSPDRDFVLQDYQEELRLKTENIDWRVN